MRCHGPITPRSIRDQIQKVPQSQLEGSWGIQHRSPESFAELMDDVLYPFIGEASGSESRCTHGGKLQPVWCPSAAKRADRGPLHSERRDYRSADRGSQTP